MFQVCGEMTAHSGPSSGHGLVEAAPVFLAVLMSDARSDRRLVAFLSKLSRNELASCVLHRIGLTINTLVSVSLSLSSLSSDDMKLIVNISEILIFSSDVSEDDACSAAFL